MLSRERIAHLDQIGLTLSTSAGFDFRSAEYRQLFDRARATAFQHPLWISKFYEALAPSCGIEPAVVTARDSKGRLKFVLPLIVRDRARVRMIEATQHIGVGDYSAPIVDDDLCLDEAALALVRSELPKILPHHDTVRIRNIREEHVPIWQKLFGGRVRNAGFSAHATVLPESPRAWRERGLDRSFRKYVDRKKRRFSNAGKARLQRIEEPSEVSEAIAAIAKLRRGRFRDDLLQSQEFCDFYREVAVVGLEEDFSRTYALSLDDEAVGYAFGVRHDRIFCYLLFGCDYERFGRYSPGLILADAIIEDWIADGGDVFDFTVGDEEFKAKFGARPTAMYELEKARTMKGRSALLLLAGKRICCRGAS